MSRTALRELKKQLGPKLIPDAQVTPPPGLATGWAQLDRYLLWRGLPKGALTLLLSEAGGATDLWVRTASPVTRAGQWVAWINDSDSELTPWLLRRREMDLAKLLVVSAPKDTKQCLWAMQELLSLCLFEVVGCDLGRLHFSEVQALKLSRLARRYQTAVVLISRDLRPPRSSVYSLVMSFARQQVTVSRAQHRPAPYTLERRDLYADTLPLLAAGRRALCG